jgi:hypothetical protein
MGFPRGWLDWIAALLSSASTRVLLNGSPGDSICHARGLRQGNPLSSMLFLLVMEVLNALIRIVDEWSLLEKLGFRAIPYRTSMYAYDLILFTKPREQDLRLLKSIFDIFHGASGLGYNLSKCQFAPIRCDEAHLQLATATFPCQVVDLPIRYLGIPLSVHKLPKTALQPLGGGGGQPDEQEWSACFDQVYSFGYPHSHLLRPGHATLVRQGPV